MKRSLLRTVFFIVFSSLTVACAAPQHAPTATPDHAPKAESVVIEGFGGGAEPLLMGQISSR
jgi:hypothetical protein